MNNSVHNIFCLDSINFGDAVNTRFWKEMTEHNIINNTNDVHYFTAGSIMCLVKNNTIILGSGFISENGDIGGGNFMSNNNNKICEPKSVISVRGPLTRDKLIKYGIECPTNYGDPLILMPCIYIKQATVNNNIIGIIPHYIDKKNINVVQLKINLENAGYTVKIIDIDIADNYEELIDNINMCEYIISSSLHGVIMGIVYKKKTCFLEFSNNVIGGHFKFNDFFKSIDINFEYNRSYNTDILHNTINVDYTKLVNIGVKLISLIPFIDQTRKEALTKIYTDFYNY